MPLMRAFFLSALLALLSLCASAFTVDGLNYTVASNVATLTGATDSQISVLTIPATVTYRGTTYSVSKVAGKAFWNYGNLRELIIEDSSETLFTDWYKNSNGINIEGDPFMNCPIEKIYIGRNLWNIWPAGNFYYNCCPISSTAAQIDLTIAGEATWIPRGDTNRGCTFIGKTNIVSLTIGGNVDEIQKDAFKGCTGLKTITSLYGKNELVIAASAFADCKNIDTFTVSRPWDASPFSVNHIGTITVKSDCRKLNSLEFSSITTLPSVDSIVVEDSEEMLECTDKTLAFSGRVEIDKIYCGRNLTGDYKLIKPRSYTANIVCNELTLGPMITVIANKYLPMSSYNNHQSPTTVYILGDVERIEDRAFDAWKRLKNINLPSSLKTIGTYAFYSTALEYLSIPSSVTTIGNSAFDFMGSLRHVVINDSEQPLETPALFNSSVKLDSMYVGREIVEVDNNSVWINCSVANLSLGGSLKHVPRNLIYYSNQLKTLNIDEGINSVGESAFSDASLLTDLSLPSSLSEIGKDAFRYCKSLETIAISAPDPPTLISRYTFDYAYNAMLTVPQGSRHAYRQDPYWGLFKTIKALGDGYTITADYNSEKGSVTLNGKDGLDPIVIEEDEPLTITITPAEKYKVLAVKLNDNDITQNLDQGRTYTIPSVVSNHHIVASFIEDTSTSVSDVKSEKSLIVSGQTVTIPGLNNDDAPISIIDIHGRTIYQGNDNVIKLPGNGIFFLNYNGTTHKLIFNQ